MVDFDQVTLGYILRLLIFYARFKSRITARYNLLFALSRLSADPWDYYTWLDFLVMGRVDHCVMLQSASGTHDDDLLFGLPYKMILTSM